MTKPAKLLWAAIGWTLLFSLLLIPALVIDGFVLLRLYEWFVLPRFSSAPVLSLGEMIGISLTIGFAVRQLIVNEGKKTGIHALTFLYVSPWFTLLLGYVIHLLVA